MGCSFPLSCFLHFPHPLPPTTSLPLLLFALVPDALFRGSHRESPARVLLPAVNSALAARLARVIYLALKRRSRGFYGPSSRHVTCILSALVAVLIATRQVSRVLYAVS